MSRLQWALKELRSLGLLNWCRFKVANARARGMPENQLVRVHVTGGVELFYRAHTSDRRVLYQIFVDREYRCLDHVRDAALIVDCGANVGYSSAYFLARYVDAHVIAVEPDTGNFEMLRRNVSRYAERVTLINSGVWSSSTGLVISEPAAEAWAFTVREARLGERATLHAVDIGTLLAQSGYERISILKVDIEGSEKEVFRSAPWLEKVDYLVIELHGPECERIVYGAVGDNARVSRCDELTVFDLRFRNSVAAPG
jgi:FkbM family methyltransferase